MDPPSVKYLIGDVRKVLRGLRDESVHLVITSPPYYGLRSYDVPSKIWDGDPNCEHEWIEESYQRRSNDSGKSEKQLSNKGANSRDVPIEYKVCKKCGAWNGCLGLERTPDLYVKHLVDVSKEIWRVLRNDGVFVLNLGDSYAGGGPHHGDRNLGKSGTNKGTKTGIDHIISEIKPKNLIGIPFRVALALQDDGWIWRSCIPWIRTGSMPDSTEDRPGSAVEYIHMFSKTNETQFWTHPEKNGVRKQPKPDYRYIDLKEGKEYTTPPPGFDLRGNKRWKRINLWDGHDYYYDHVAVQLKGKIPAGTMAAKGSIERYDQSGVNARPPEYKEYTGVRGRRNSDWFLDSLQSILDGEQGLLSNEDGDPLVLKVNPEQLGETHYATYPQALVLPFILSGSSEAGICPHCGAPWSRVLERKKIRPPPEEYVGKMKDTDAQFSGRRILANMKAQREAGLPHDNPFIGRKTIGWHPTCSCPKHQPIRSVILDPFVGSGTTLLAAYHLGRDSIGIDINKEYAEIAKRRFKKKGGYEHRLGELA